MVGIKKQSDRRFFSWFMGAEFPFYCGMMQHHQFLNKIKNDICTRRIVYAAVVFRRQDDG